MTTAFILRFQEDCLPPDVNEMSTVGLTKTFVAREQPDYDPNLTNYSALKSGTATNTRILNEQGDTDRGSDTLAIPKQTQINFMKTVTEAPRENCDINLGYISNQIIPRCF